jgi:hypothetical protein
LTRSTGAGVGVSAGAGFGVGVAGPAGAQPVKTMSTTNTRQKILKRIQASSKKNPQQTKKQLAKFCRGILDAGIFIF